MMSLRRVMDEVSANVARLTTGELEHLVREVPLRADDVHQSAVGAAIESVLVDRYRARFGDLTDAEVFAEGHRHPGDEYRDRVDRARCDAAFRVLEQRHPGEPFDTFPWADDLENVPEGAWRAHARAFYGIK